MDLTRALARAVERARHQHDLLSTTELLAEGLGHTQIQRLHADGFLERVIQALYRIAGTRTRLQDMAALQRRHRGSAVSHLSAIELHGEDARRARRPQVTLPPGRTSRSPLGSIHRSPLDPAEIVLVHGIPTTALARSVVDAAEELDVRALGTLVETLVGKQRIRIDDVVDTMAAVERSPGRSGLGRLRVALAPWTERIGPDSVAEAVVFRRIVEAGLPVPTPQFEIRDPAGTFVARVDLAWPEHRVAREYDSHRHHGEPRLEVDELRRQRIEAVGWRIDTLHRGHLVPGREDWLHRIRRDLGVR